jgi:hypothetical protein
MLGRDTAAAVHVVEISTAEKRWTDLDLRNHHLHAPVGIADGDLTGHLKSLGPTTHPEAARVQPQGGCRSQAVAAFEPQKQEPAGEQQEQRQGEQKWHVGRLRAQRWGA